MHCLPFVKSQNEKLDLLRVTMSSSDFCSPRRLWECQFDPNSLVLVLSCPLHILKVCPLLVYIEF